MVSGGHRPRHDCPRCRLGQRGALSGWGRLRSTGPGRNRQAVCHRRSPPTRLRPNDRPESVPDRVSNCPRRCRSRCSPRERYPIVTRSGRAPTSSKRPQTPRCPGASVALRRPLRNVTRGLRFPSHSGSFRLSTVYRKAMSLSRSVYRHSLDRIRRQAAPTAVTSLPPALETPGMKQCRRRNSKTWFLSFFILPRFQSIVFQKTAINLPIKIINRRRR